MEYMEYNEFMSMIKEHEAWLAGEGGKRMVIADKEIMDGDKAVTVTLKDVNLSKAIMKHVGFTWLHMENVNLEWANLSGIYTYMPGTWKNVDLNGANMEKADLMMTNFDDVDFSNSNMKKSCMSLCYFKNCELESADWEGANLEGAAFDETDASFLDASKENVKDTASIKKVSMTRFEIEMAVNDLADQVAYDYDVPKNFYGDCYPDDVMRLENRMEMNKENIDEYMNEVREIFESYAKSYKEYEEDEEN